MLLRGTGVSNKPSYLVIPLATLARSVAYVTAAFCIGVLAALAW